MERNPQLERRAKQTLKHGEKRRIHRHRSTRSKFPTNHILRYLLREDRSVNPPRSQHRSQPSVSLCQSCTDSLKPRKEDRLMRGRGRSKEVLKQGPRRRSIGGRTRSKDVLKQGPRRRSIGGASEGEPAACGNKSTRYAYMHWISAPTESGTDEGTGTSGSGAEGSARPGSKASSAAKAKEDCGGPAEAEGPGTNR